MEQLAGMYKSKEEKIQNKNHPTVRLSVTLTWNVFRTEQLGFKTPVAGFLSDPGIPGVRSMGPSLSNSLRHLVET